MTTADVTKLSCEFVRKVKLYITQSKYIAEPCMDDIQYYFSKYKLATTLADCLTHEDECDLSIIASTIVSEPVIPPVIVSCDGLVDITLTKSTVPCVYTTTLQKLSGVASAYPDIVLSEDDVTQSAFINVVTSGCGDFDSASIESGCKNITNNSSPVCAEVYKFELNIYFNLNGLQNHPTGYIKTLRIYQTDSSGDLINTPIDLNLSPSNLSAWVACGLCSGISAAELRFGHPNWASAFKELLDNVVYTLQGSLDARWVVSFGTNYISIGNTVKHNPASEWYGINKDDFKVEWVNDSGITLKILSPSSTAYIQSPSYMAQDFTLNVTCGEINGRVVMNGGLASYSTNSNFNYLELTSTELSKPASIVNLDSPTCNKTALTASYATDAEIILAEWLDPSDDFISEDLSIIVTEPGEYTFTALIGEGCSASETITV